MAQHLTNFQTTLLSGWEDNHKKGQLTFWILLSLADKPRHMAAIKQFITAESKHTISADDKSMYRALRRFHEAQLVHYTTKPAKGGPDVKEYQLTDDGIAILRAFIERNITAIYYRDSMQHRLTTLTNPQKGER